MHPLLSELGCNLKYALLPLSNATGVFLDRLTALVFIVVRGDFDYHRCHAEGPSMAKVAEDDFAVHWGLAARYATAFSPPMRSSVPSLDKVEVRNVLSMCLGTVVAWHSIWTNVRRGCASRSSTSRSRRGVGRICGVGRIRGACWDGGTPVCGPFTLCKVCTRPATIRMRSGTVLVPRLSLAILGA